MYEDEIDISEILDEMKSQFNKSMSQLEKEQPKTEMNNSITELDPENEREHIKLEEFENFEKIMQQNSPQDVSCEIINHSQILANNTSKVIKLEPVLPNESINNTQADLCANIDETISKSFEISEIIDSATSAVLKRSSRRRPNECNESILQSAIARKEKSFGEYAKPQRLTRHAKLKEASCERKNGRILKRLISPSTSAKMSFDAIGRDLPDRDTPPVIPLEQLQALAAQIASNGSDDDEYNLIEAVERADLAKVASILSTGNVDVTSKLSDFNMGTLLHLAVRKGCDLSVIYLLVSARIDIDVLDKDQNTALMLAVSEQKNDVVRYLAKAGADLSLKGTDGMTSLHVAAKCGNLEACRIVLSGGGGVHDFVNVRDDGGWTPLVWACENGFLDVAKFLVSRGADVHLRDVEHNVALHWAAFSGSVRIVELLLDDWRCDVNVANVHGDTPLHISAREDQYDCVLTFLARNADVSSINRNNETPLDCAPENGKSFDAIALNVQLKSVVSAFRDRRKSLLNNDISRGRELNPVQCVNNVDFEDEPKDYTYIKRNCITSDGIKIETKVSTVRSCTCQDRCTSSNCACAKLSLKCWYDDEGKLLPEFNFCDPPLIFECNEMCACNAILCANRLVQRPTLQRFQLFKTASKGWGVRTLNVVARGSYVCEYVGEVLTDVEADHRDDDSYLFDLDNRDADSFCIDAKFYGNFARFINHSCDPNLHSVKVFVDHHDLRFPRIALFARRDIAADEELCFDYGDKFWLIKYKSFTCDCRSDDCKYSKESIGRTLQKYQTTDSLSGALYLPSSTE